ncbi:hypothetical protein M3Y98_00797100 [Aphelenchoides besseyi]|nr:hypothetical protein M3Y98_00797100 [Aphelenchoides besseyi]KAI6212000.1 hypothetical protein M3Y96_00493900 [Aphelenchoides besseyi]
MATSNNSTSRKPTQRSEKSTTLVKMTHDKYRNVVDSSMINDLTKLFIVNAVYFKGNWDKPFKEELTTKETFYVFENKSHKVKLPRFKVDFEIRLNEVLKKLGLSDAFSEHANFSTITHEPRFISESIHKVLIEVNEQGTVAAAYSIGACGCPGSTPPPKKIFRADHPFLYAIFYESHPLFIGTFFG